MTQPSKMVSRECTECGDEFRTKYSKQLYCQTCQVLRDFRVRPNVFSKPRECTFCGGEFWPFRTTHLVCYDCSSSAQYIHDTECNVCGEANRIAPGLDNTCIKCVQKSRENRTLYRNAIQARAKTRKAAKIAAEKAAAPVDLPIS